MTKRKSPSQDVGFVVLTKSCIPSKNKDEDEDEHEYQYQDCWQTDSITMFSSKHSALEFIREKQAQCNLDEEMSFDQSTMFYTYDEQLDDDDVCQQTFMDTYDHQTGTFIAKVHVRDCTVYVLVPCVPAQTIHLCEFSCFHKIKLRVPVQVNKILSSSNYPFRLGHEVDDLQYHVEHEQGNRFKLRFPVHSTYVRYQADIKTYIIKFHRSFRGNLPVPTNKCVDVTYDQVYKYIFGTNDWESEEQKLVRENREKRELEHQRVLRWRAQEQEELEQIAKKEEQRQRKEQQLKEMRVVITLDKVHHIMKPSKFFHLCETKRSMLEQMFHHPGCQLRVYYEQDDMQQKHKNENKRLKMKDQPKNQAQNQDEDKDTPKENPGFTTFTGYSSKFIVATDINTLLTKRVTTEYIQDNEFRMAQFYDVDNVVDVLTSCMNSFKG